MGSQLLVVTLLVKEKGNFGFAYCTWGFVFSHLFLLIACIVDMEEVKGVLLQA